MSEGAKRGGGEKGLANSEKRKRGKGREREKGGENGAREGGAKRRRDEGKLEREEIDVRSVTYSAARDMDEQLGSLNVRGPQRRR